jgi:hypothetical protein
MVFIITILLLAADFYYLKNIAGRRLVGLRWWNEVNPQTGDTHWVFESAPQPNEPGGRTINATDRRFFWLALYVQPAFWIALAVLAIIRFKLLWLPLVGEYHHTKTVVFVPFEIVLLTWSRLVIAMVLTITNTLAFSRCDKFSQASGLVERGLYSGSLARNVGGALVSRLFTRS